MSEKSLVVVTTVFNNPGELDLTAGSIIAQSSPPDHWFLIDSSDKSISHRVKERAQEVGAEYLWCPPQGVYPAMNIALRHIPQDSWVWFVNSSDWLADRDAVKRVKEALRNPESGWLIGSLVRRQRGLQPTLRTWRTGAQFVDCLRHGKAGFPHPAAIMKTRSILRLGGFDESIRVSSDFDLALRFAGNSGPPELIDEIIAVQEAGGLSTRFFFQNLLEQSQSLGRNGQWFSQINVFFISLGRALTRLWKRLRNVVGLANQELQDPDSLGYAVPTNGHFCESTASSWPECCRDFLMRSSWL